MPTTALSSPTSPLLRHEDVEGLRVGRFGWTISSACILYRVGDTVIDTGPPNQWSRVRRFLEERSVARVLITHHHEDHSGNGGRLARDFRADVYVPAPGLEPVREGFPLQPYQRIIWGRPLRFAAEPVPEQLWLEDGLQLRAIATPGHSPDSTCYLEPDRGWLFSGDLYIASRPRFFRADEDVDETIASLRRVARLDFGALFCAHRGVLSDGPALIRNKLDYLVSLRDEVRELHRHGRSVAEITRLVLGRENVMSYLTWFHFSKRNLVRACLDSSRHRPPA